MTNDSRLRVALIYFGLPRTYEKCVPSHVKYLAPCADICEIHVLIWDTDDVTKYISYLQRIYKDTKFHVHTVQWKPVLKDRREYIPSYLLANIFAMNFKSVDCVMTIRPDVLLLESPPVQKAIRHLEGVGNALFRAAYMPISAANSLDRFHKLGATDILLLYKADMDWHNPVQEWEHLINLTLTEMRAEDILSSFLRNQGKDSFYLNYEIPFSWNVCRDNGLLVSKRTEFFRGLKYMLRYLF